MALPLSSLSGFAGAQLGTGRSGAGYTPNTTLDSGVIDKLRETGKSIIPTNFNADQVKEQSIPTVQPTVAGGIPVFRSATGNDYVVDEKNIVYEVDPRKDTGISTGLGVGLSTGLSTGAAFGPTPPPPPPGSGVGSGKLFSVFSTDDVVPNQQETVTRALWTGNVGNLTTFFTSSVQTAAQKKYYYEIYNSASLSSCNAEAQFSIAYGNRFGSGSEDEGGQIEDTPTRAIYGQYRLLCLDPTDEAFIINGQTANSIYVVNVNRARMLESLDEGNIELNLAYLSGSQWIAKSGSNSYTGSAIGLAGNGAVLRLIDDSSINPATIKQSGEVYNIVSGSIEDGVFNSTNPVIYGQLFKRKGIIVLNGDMLDASASFGTATPRELDGDNIRRFFISISGSAKYTDGSGDPLGFQGRGSEKVKSTHYFVRVKNSDYNFSNNPTFVTGSEGDLRHPDMYGDPKTYITTIGLYNTNKDLVAVAKLSQPIKKSYKEEALIKVKLDF